jgi:hypothetical protein
MSAGDHYQSPQCLIEGGLVFLKAAEAYVGVVRVGVIVIEK